MKISELGGEVSLINLIQAKYGVTSRRGLVVGMGDDAALVECGDDLLIVTTDLLIENTHFRLDINEPYLLGWKSAAVNLSDIAAMGGAPTYAFVSIGLPDVDVRVVESIYEGMRDVSAKYDSALAGGDTVGSGCGIVINVTQLGRVEPDLAARRSGARPGDAVLVTNTLGDSRAGFELLLARGLDGARAVSAHLVERHLKPEPRINEARAAVTTGKVTAMMDLSDGLASDIVKLCAASGVGARIQAEDVPVSPDLRKAAGLLRRDAAELAISGGEDYELLITCRADDSEQIVRAVEKTGSTAAQIGEIVEGREAVLVGPDGSEQPMPSSWEHF